MTRSAFVVFYDLPLCLVMLVRSDHLHPNSQSRHLIKAIGGEVEPGETDDQAAVREAHEEVPGWAYNRSCLGTGGLTHVSTTEEDMGHGRGCMLVSAYVCEADLSPVSYKEAVACCTEGTPECWGLYDEQPEDQVFLWFRRPLENVLYRLRTSS